MSQQNLITPFELSLYGASSEFLEHFRPRPIEISISTAGVLGTMRFCWRFVGEDTWSAPIPTDSDGEETDVALPDPSWCCLLFSAGTYVVDDVYTIASSGLVTPAGLVNASRFDLRDVQCEAVTSKSVTWMLPRCVPPIISVGSQIKEWMANMVIYSLRSRSGMTPSGAGSGDDNVRALAESGEKNLKAIGISEDRPPDLVDSSSDAGGAGFNAYPIGDDLRGW